MSNPLRPNKFEDIVGQQDTIERLKIVVDSANKRSKPMGHTLIGGLAGLGKTTIAVAIAEELGEEIQIANASTVNSPKQMLPYLMRLNERSVLFIDEIHALRKKTEEFLYPVMEDFRVDIGKENDVMSMELPKFTLIGATTESGALSHPLYDRFIHKFHLRPYDIESLCILVEANAKKMELSLNSDAVKEIAKRSRGIPRIANSLLKWTRDYLLSHNCSHNAKNVVKAMEMTKVDENGMTEEDRRYVNFIQKCKGNPVGLETISAGTGIDTDTIKRVIEPYLLRTGKIRKTSRGRVLNSSQESK